MLGIINLILSDMVSILSGGIIVNELPCVQHYTQGGLQGPGHPGVLERA